MKIFNFLNDDSYNFSYKYYFRMSILNCNWLFYQTIPIIRSNRSRLLRQLRRDQLLLVLQERRVRRGTRAAPRGRSGVGTGRGRRLRRGGGGADRETNLGATAPQLPQPEMGNCYLKKNQLPTTLPIASILSSWHYQLK